jgi:polyvinyl alcohol dehydrogenase (cytochrome)
VLACGASEEERSSDAHETHSALAAQSGKDWRMAAYDAQGTGNNVEESRLERSNVGALEVKWTFDVADAGAPVAPIHANPVVADGETFVGSTGGTFYGITRGGVLKWSFETLAPGPLLAQIYGSKAPVLGAAVLPAHERSVVFGDVDGRVYKLDRDTGALLWTFDLDDHDLGGVFGNSLMIAGDTVYVGLASFEPLAPSIPGRTCCTHRGAVVALDLGSGATRWRYDVIRESEQGPFPQWLIDELGTVETFGPSGGDIWSQPTLDPNGQTLYVGTGQLFSRAPDGTGPATHDAVIALDAETGLEKWVAHLSDNLDVFRFDIPFFDPATGQHFDKDVADQPKVYRLANGRKVVGAAQKNGQYHVLDAATGARIESTQLIDMVTGEGGFQSGGALAGNNVFEHGVTTSANPAAPYDGVVMAINPRGTRVKWRIDIPASPLFGSLAVANGVLFFQSPFEEPIASAGDPPAWALYAVHSGTGSVLKRIPFSNARALNGPVVSRGRVYAAFGGAFEFGLASAVNEGGVVCFGLPGND